MIEKKYNFFTYRLVLIGLLAIIGCATLIPFHPKVMSNWIGAHRSDLIAQWGPPDQIISDGWGGSILIYKEVYTWTTSKNNSQNLLWDVFC